MVRFFIRIVGSNEILIDKIGKGRERDKNNEIIKEKNKYIKKK
jgi:hypothetical protein